jgi:hypothetical protein
VFFNIVELYVPTSQEGIIDDEFRRYLNVERSSGTKVYGMPDLKDTVATLRKKGSLESLKCAFVKLELFTPGNFSVFHLFPAEKDKVFTIGRAHECEIVISQNTISRDQCRILFSNGRWYIRDGSEERESANGTWLCLTDYRLRHLKQWSDLHPLE